MRKNQHRWRKWIEDARIRDVLEEAAIHLKLAWDEDQKDPTSYPINTSYLFGQIDEHLEGEPKVRSGVKLPPPAPPPEKFSELVDDRTVVAVYEDQNDGSYKDALRHAAKGFGEGAKAWRKILRAVDIAYAIDYCGVEFAPKPRVHFLHRNLLALTESKHLSGLTLEGVVEFFDDICPCGQKHTADAIRKLQKRRARGLRARRT